MTQLTLLSPASSYGDLLTTTNGGNGLSNVLQQLQDGFGNASTITISTIAVNFNRMGGNSFQLDNVAMTAQSVDINSICQPNPVALGNQGLTVPRGTTAQRPGAPVNGTIRYNTDTSQLEAFSGGAWVAIA